MINNRGRDLSQGRDLFYLETQFAGFTLDEIINHENTRYDSTIRTPTPANEPSISHYLEYVRRNSGTDWIVYLTYHVDAGPSDFYWQFSLVPPRDSDIHLVLIGLRESVHSPIVAYSILLGEKDSKTLFLSPLPDDFHILTDFMDWNGRVHPPQVVLEYI